MAKKVYVKVPYTPIEYIEATGTQYIDSGEVARPTLKIVADYQFTSTSPTQQRVFGRCINTSTANTLTFAFYINGSSKWAWAIQNNVGNWQSTNVNADTNRHTVTLDSYNGTITIDSSYTASITTTRTNTDSKTIYILANNKDNLGSQEFAKAKLYSMQIYDSDVLIHNFIPVKDQNEKACLFDTITHKFYTNKGTGEFVAGNETGEPVEIMEKCNKLYVGITNIAKRLYFGYVGVGNLARKFYDIRDYLQKSTATGSNIYLTDSCGVPPSETDILGNATQDTNILTYKCVGTETGDYYFVYSSTNYQFTMPTISEGDILTFNTSTKKLYKGTTQITTTTASTGTLITLSTTPNPDYPQDINIVTGDNTVNITGKNMAVADNPETPDANYTWSGNGSQPVQYSTENGGYYTTVHRSRIFRASQSGKYTISLAMKRTDTSTGNAILFRDRKTSEIKAYILRQNLTSEYVRYSRTLTLTEGQEINAIFYVGFCWKDIQFEFNASATTFEQYKGKSITLPLISNNLLNFTMENSSNYKGLTITRNKNIFTINGTCTGDTSFGVSTNAISNYSDYMTGATTFELEAGTYTFKAKFLGTQPTSFAEFGSIRIVSKKSTTPYDIICILNVGNQFENTFTITEKKDVFIATTHNSTVVCDNVSFELHLQTGLIYSLASIGNYQDTIFHAVAGNTIYDSLDSTTQASLTSGSWYKQNNILKITNLGTKNWTKGSDTASNSYYYCSAYDSDILGSASAVMGKCNKFTCITGTVSTTNVIKIVTDWAHLRIYIDNTIFSGTATEWKTWLTNNNVILYAVATNPTYTQITETTLLNALNELENAKLNNPTTNIWTTPSGNNAKPIIDITYFIND